jgi:hypothetical protein
LSFTIPADNHVIGDTTHVPDHGDIADMLTLLANFNVMQTAYDGGAAGNGVADDYGPVQAALTAANDEGGGLVVVPPGTYLLSETPQIGSGTVLWAPGGYGSAIFRAKTGWSPAQVGSNTGAPLLATIGNNAASDIIISGITFDGNQQNISSLPGYADAPESSPLGLWNVTDLRILDCQVINSIGYSLYLKFCTRAWVQRCRVLSGQGGSSWSQQDGIHVTDSSRIWVLGNDVDTGTGTAGDDGIAIQSYLGCSDITVRDNKIRSAAHGVAVVLSGGSVTNVQVHDNDIWATEAEAVICYWDTGTVGTATNLSIKDNTGGDIGTSTEGSVISVEVPFVNLTIEGNDFAGFNNTSGNGFFIRNTANTTASKDLNLNGNTISGFAGSSLALIGEGGCGIAGVNINDNILDGTASGSLANGIVLSDSTDGSVSGNTVLGVTTASSYGIQIYGDDTAPTGLCVNGNRVKGWANAIYEFDAGAQPDYNTYVGNNCHGCTNFITTSGSHDVVASNVVA